MNDDILTDHATQPPSAQPPPRWSLERRLEFIASRLGWERRINRADLVQRFGVSPNQATADLARFEALSPGALKYDARAKTYRAGRGAPGPDQAAAGSLLRELRLIAEGVLPAAESALAAPPPLDVAKSPARPVPPDTLALVIAAIRESRELTASYASFSAPSRRRRRLEPHALVFDGFRWHARARDVSEKRFRDFVLGRLADVALAGPAMFGAADDAEWNARVELEIEPHPGLAPHQRAAIAADYAMTGERLILTPRVAVAWYVKRRLGLLPGHRDRAPADQHIVLIGERAAG